jgi:hypothetical protein
MRIYVYMLCYIIFFICFFEETYQISKDNFLSIEYAECDEY